MRLIDAQYMQTPFYDSPKMTAWRLSNPSAGPSTDGLADWTPTSAWKRLEAALSISQPENFNPHQGIQFTSLGIFASAWTAAA